MIEPLNHQRQQKDFWAEITPDEHFVQIYANDETFLNTLTGFVSSGIRTGDSVIVITTLVHRIALEDRLRAAGINIELSRNMDQYIPIDATEALSQFMVNGWPDDELFTAMVSGLITRSRNKGKTVRRVRAFGEMVALLWAQGQNGAAVQLEHLWNKFCETEAFCLYCAYPKSGFTQNATESMREICSTHSRVIAG